MALDAFVSAAVGLDDFNAAKRMLVKIADNAAKNPKEPKFRKLRPSNPKLAQVLFPEALGVLFAFGFRPVEQDSEWLELSDVSLANLAGWIDELNLAQLEKPIPDGLRSALLSGGAIFGHAGLLLSRSVCRQWRREAQGALLQLTQADVPGVIEALQFKGWFTLNCERTTGDPIEEFHTALIGSPLTCYAGGDMRLQRANFLEISEANLSAFCRLNPWEMLRVGPYGVRERYTEPKAEWWATLFALVTSSELRGRQWQWSERTSQYGKSSIVHVRHIVYCLELGPERITVTMRAVWNSEGLAM